MMFCHLWCVSHAVCTRATPQDFLYRRIKKALPICVCRREVLSQSKNTRHFSWQSYFYISFSILFCYNFGGEKCAMR